MSGKLELSFQAFGCLVPAGRFKSKDPEHVIEAVLDRIKPQTDRDLRIAVIESNG